MSSAGMRGMISNNAGAPHYFQKRYSGDAGVNSDAGANNAAAAGRRRSSGQKFEKLDKLKRNSQDASAAARRASYVDSNKKPGIFGAMWDSWTRGTGK